MHAATFGGNPIAAAAGIATLEMIEQENLLDAAKNLGVFFEQRLNEIAEESELIDAVRVCGAMVGIELNIPGSSVVEECMRQGLLINCTQGNILRFLPAMNLSQELAEEGCEILEEVLASGAIEGE